MAASAAASNYLSNEQLPSVTSVTGTASGTAYPYFTSPGVDLYSGYSATSAASHNGSSSSTGVFSSKTLQPSRPRSKSRANAGKTGVVYCKMSTWVDFFPSVWWWSCSRAHTGQMVSFCLCKQTAAPTETLVPVLLEFFVVCKNCIFVVNWLFTYMGQVS